VEGADLVHVSLDAAELPNGVNARWATLSILPVLSTEVVVRTHVHGRAMLARGSAELDPG
jgi:hypothetical protein